jgi:NAD(P) transhydrogenase subunit alpha
VREKHEVFIETGAGLAAGHSDDQYTKSGAKILKTAAAVYKAADIILKVQPPRKAGTHKHEAELFRDGCVYIGYLAPLTHPDVVKIFQRKKITAFAMEYLPRITRAQSMDAMSSMATIAGYKAASASEISQRCFCSQTAAGTIPPATVLVLGRSGWTQAIATADGGAKSRPSIPVPLSKNR